MKFVQLVMGPAGSGKSTYCKTFQEHCAASGRKVFVGNLDPAAEDFHYDVAFDIRNMMTVEEAMDALGLGPNGGLMYCMEYLNHDTTWLDEQLDSFGEDDYLLLDCPGQLELFTHVGVLPRIVRRLQRTGWNVCGVFLTDATFMTDISKLLAGMMSALSVMVHLEIPHVNVLSKCDILPAEQYRDLLKPSATELAERVRASAVAELAAPEGPAAAAEAGEPAPRPVGSAATAAAAGGSKRGSQAAAEPSADAPGMRFAALNDAFASVIDDYSLVGYVPCNREDEEGLAALLAHLDMAMQYGEDIEPMDPDRAEEAVAAQQAQSVGGMAGEYGLA